MKHSSIKSPDNIEFNIQLYAVNRKLRSHYNQIKTIFSVIILSLALSVGYAQDINPEQQVKVQESYPRSIVSFLPLYMAVNAVRIDYDISLTPQHWIQMAPALYLRNNRMNPDIGPDFLHLKGAGLHLYHRFYPGGKNFDRSNVYISYGPIYQHLYFTYIEENNNVESERYTRLDRLGADIIIGITAPVFDPLFILDFYAGMGFRYVFIESNATEPKKFNNRMGDYGHFGNTLILGFRLSVPLK